MTQDQPRRKTLVVGPMGARPWRTPDELAAQLIGLGHEVVVNQAPDRIVIPYPSPLPPRVGAAANFLPRVLWWLARMLWGWRGRTRVALADGGFSHILVWDPVLAALFRFARPTGVELVWVLPPPEGPRLYQRAMRFILVLAADRVVVSYPGESGFARRRETVVAPATTGQAIAGSDDWIVIAGDHPPSLDALAALSARRAVRAATAIVFDSRDHDRLTPEMVEVVRRASGASRVWWVGDDELTAWLGGAPREAVDPNHSITADHRHHWLLAAGTTVLVRAASKLTRHAPVVEAAAADAGGWVPLAFRDATERGVADDAWASAVLGPARATDDESGARRRVSACPLCGAIGRRIVTEIATSTFVVRCARCHLHRATEIRDPTIAGAMRPVPSEDLRANVLHELDAPPGRVLGVGGPPAPFCRSAHEAGWRAEHVSDLRHTAGSGRFDAVVIGSALLLAPDPLALLREIHDTVLTPDGWLVIDLPNVRSFGRIAHRRTWPEWQSAPNGWYLDDWSLRQLLHRAGFASHALRTETEIREEHTEVFKGPTTRGLLRAGVALIDRAGYGQRLVALGQRR